MTRSTIDWSPLGGFDPAPGDPARVAEAATAQRDMVHASVTLAADTQLIAFDAGSGTWRGEASEAFVGAFTPLPGLVERFSDAAARANDALLDWQGRLTELQVEADGLLADAVAVQAAIVSAEHAVSQAQGQESAARWALREVQREADDPADAGDVWRAAARLDRAADARARAEHAVDDLRGDLARLRLRAIALKARHQFAAVRTAWQVTTGAPDPTHLPEFVLRLTAGGIPPGMGPLTNGDGRLTATELELLRRALSSADPALVQQTLDALSAAELAAAVAAFSAETANPPVGDYQAVTELLTIARALALDPAAYAATLDVYWVLRAAEEAGIDMAAWDPSLGADVNAHIIAAVYTYYGQLYAANPDLAWAGMANMIGPSFAAGFFDLALFRKIAQKVDDMPKPPGVLPAGLDAVARMSEEELRFFETTFLEMQRQIFLDQATMHQAFVDGGMPAIRELEAAGLITPEILQAWADVDSGVPARVNRGNERFLLQEQRDVIADEYQQMTSHPVTGEAMTWLMTLIGAPSIPGAQGYPDVFPLVVSMETPGPSSFGLPGFTVPSPWGSVGVPGVSVDNPAQGEVHVTTPFPDGNIANFDDRWNLIADDTLPAFLDLLETDPDRAMAIITSDVEGRIDDYRLDERVDEILRHLIDFDVDFDQ